MNVWCALAVAKINGALGASGKASLSIDITPPQCSASIRRRRTARRAATSAASATSRRTRRSARAARSKSTARGAARRTPRRPPSPAPVAARASAAGAARRAAAWPSTATASATAPAPRRRASATERAAHADGTCQGSCSAKCTASATAPAIKCSGTCSGKCDASCKATPGQASVKCSGKCDADFTPVSCTGGKLEGGCNVDAKCQGNCNASASAKAECTPPKVNIVAAASATTDLGVLVASLEANLPSLLLVVQARGQAFLDLIGPNRPGRRVELRAKLDVKGTACLTAAARRCRRPRLRRRARSIAHGGRRRHAVSALTPHAPRAGRRRAREPVAESTPGLPAALQKLQTRLIVQRQAGRADDANVLRRAAPGGDHRDEQGLRGGGVPAQDRLARELRGVPRLVHDGARITGGATDLPVVSSRSRSRRTSCPDGSTDAVIATSAAARSIAPPRKQTVARIAAFTKRRSGGMSAPRSRGSRYGCHCG